jgi:uncharacterized Tic20 family protein
VNRGGLTWYFVGFALLLASGALIGTAAISFFASLTPLYLAIGASVAAIVCAMVALARHVQGPE